jgi:hypothetical protein
MTVNALLAFPHCCSKSRVLKVWVSIENDSMIVFVLLKKITYIIIISSYALYDFCLLTIQQTTGIATDSIKEVKGAKSTSEGK